MVSNLSEKPYSARDARGKFGLSGAWRCKAASCCAAHESLQRTLAASADLQDSPADDRTAQMHVNIGLRGTVRPVSSHEVSGTPHEV